MTSIAIGLIWTVIGLYFAGLAAYAAFHVIRHPKYPDLGAGLLFAGGSMTIVAIIATAWLAA